jgi:fibronectin type 3 domain-containing protein
VTAKAVSVSEIDLAWTGVRAATSYRVLRATTPTGPFTSAGSPTTTSFADTGLNPGTKYFYEVEAVNATGPSAPSRIATATTIPAAPTGVVATAVSPTTSFTDSNLSQQKTYYYVIEAVGPSGTSAPSAQVSATTFGG